MSNQSPSQTPTEEKVDQAQKRKMQIPKVVLFLASVFVIVQAGENLLSSFHKKVSTFPCNSSYQYLIIILS